MTRIISSSTRHGALLLVLAMGLLLSAPATVLAAGASGEQILVDKAALTLRHFQTGEEMAWYRDLLRETDAVLIAPEMFKAGLLIGGSGGKGVMFVRDEGIGVWRGPIFYNLGAVSVGLQIGTQVAEVVILVMNREGVDVLRSSTVKLGTDVSVAAGPVGSGAEGAVAPRPNASFLSFMLAKGAFIGVTMEGALINVDTDANTKYYGKKVSPEDIIIGRVPSASGADAVRQWLAANAAKKK